MQIRGIHSIFSGVESLDFSLKTKKKILRLLNPEKMMSFTETSIQVNEINVNMT